MNCGPQDIEVRPQPVLRAARKEVHFSPSLWWTILLLLHTMSFTYYGSYALFYTHIQGSNLQFQLETYDIGISTKHDTKIAILHVVFAVFPGCGIVMMLLSSLMSCRLVYRPTGLTSAVKVHAYLFRILTSHFVSPRVHSFSMAMSRGRSFFTGADGVIERYINSFDDVHIIRELVETMFQSVQAYRMTYHLARPWLNRFFLMLLILNCWSTPILYYYFAERRASRRFLNRVCDAVLDVMTTIGVAFVICYTYFPQYTDPVYGFPFEIWFQDKWFTNMQQEFQMMLVVSWSDMAGRMIIALSLIQCMEVMKNMLTKTKRSLNPPGGIITPPLRKSERTVRRFSIIDSITESAGPLPSCRRRRMRWALHNVIPSFLVLWGAFILAVHIVSEIRHGFVTFPIPYALPLRPWFVWKPACALYEINCRTIESRFSVQTEKLYHERDQLALVAG